MITNYIKVAFRNLWRNKLYAFINIFGLSVAIGCCIVAYLNLQFNDDFDAFHANARAIFRVESVRTVNGAGTLWGIVPVPLAPALQKDFPAIVRAVRFTERVAVVRSGEQVFNEQIGYADKDFFEMFSFPMVLGPKDVLKDRDKAVISERYALKYFGKENPIGRQLRILYREGLQQIVTVGAVVKKIPGNSSIRFDILLSSEQLEAGGLDNLADWSHWTSTAFVQLDDPGRIAALRSATARYVAIQNSANPKNPISGLEFEPLLDIIKTSRELKGNSLVTGSPPSAIVGPTIVAVLLLLMACFNYVNTSIAFSFNRMKEIGIRKVVGGNRTQLVRQFLGENLVVCALSMVVALGVAELLVPGFRNLFPFVEIELNYLQNVRLLLFLIGLLITTALLAGAYPAYYITAYRPAALLRGTQKIGKSTLLMRTLLAAQFAMSMVAVGTGIVFAINAQFQGRLDVGYSMDRLINVPVANESQFTIFRDELGKDPRVEHLAGSRDQVFFGWGRKTIQSDGTVREAQLFSVGFDYMETTGFRLKQGRLFSRDLQSDEAKSAIVTEKTVREFGWSEPLGKTLEIDTARYTVIGVIEDFYNNGVWRPIEPSIFRMANPSAFRFLVAKISDRQTATALTFLSQTWSRLFPDAPFEGFFQERAMLEGISVSHSITVLFAVIGSLALVISTMGLFALVSLGIARRTKEIGIRKVLGASVASLLQLLNKEFILLLLLSSVAADVMGFYSAKSLLDGIYAYHTEVSIFALIVANATVLITGLVTAGLQTFRVATANPVEALRYE
jgi:putative ABC transport system permease protein